MTTRIVVVLALVLAGCGDSVIGPEPEPMPTINPVGSYTLALVGSKPLPADLSMKGDCKPLGDFCVTAGSLEVGADGSYALAYDWVRYYPNGTVNQTGFVREPGKWEADSLRVSFTPNEPIYTPEGPKQRTYPGTQIREDELLIANGSGFTFRK